MSRQLSSLFVVLSLFFVDGAAAVRAAPGDGVLAGRAVTHDGAPAAGASVRVVGTTRAATVDADGRFELAPLPAGRYVVEAASPRFGRAVESVELLAEERLEITLELHLLVHGESVTVTASPDPRAAAEIARPVSVLEGDDLLVALEPSLGETLADQPGVSSTYFGPGASRPVIRGLGGDRIRVLDNGLGIGDVSSTSPDHAVGVEPLGSERIEIVRGPATLLYGSSAVGGVVNVLDGSIPDFLPEAPVIGSVTLRGGSVADERAGAAAFDGRLGRLAWHLSASKRQTEDHEIPGFAESRYQRAADEDEHEEEEGEEHEEEEEAFGILPNSAIESESGRFGLSWVGDAGFLGVSVSGFDTLYGVPGHAHEHGEEEHGHGEGEEEAEHEEHEEEEGPVRVDLEQRRVDLRGEIARELGIFRGLKVRIGSYDYQHVELEGDEVGTRFDTDGWEARLEARHRPLGRMSGAWGVQLGRREFVAVGEEAFVPANDTESLALFLFEEIEAGALTWQLGARWEENDLGVEVAELPDRSFSGLSGSLGLVWRMTDAFSSSLSVARSVTAPNPEALYSDGMHVATRTYEIGDPTLGEEVSLGADLGFRYEGERLRAAASFFWNRVDDFVVEAFSGEEQEGADVVRFGATDAELHGFELAAHIGLWHRASSHLELDLDYDLVRGEDRITGDPLPRIPPASYGAGLSYRGDRWFASADWRRVQRQDRLAPFETPTDAYSMIDAAVGYRLFAGRTVHDLILAGKNLTDEEGRVHASYLKDLAPLPGRDLRLSYRLTF